MLNKHFDARRFKEEAYGAFAQVTKALSSPRRLELLDLLVQGPRSVDALATGVSQPVANTSQHLQVLKRAHLVQSEREGTRVVYALAPGVPGVFVALRRLAEARSPALAAVRTRWFAEAGAPETIERDELVAHLDRGTAVLLDVRSTAEHAHGHLPGAVSVPLAELQDRLEALPDAPLYAVTCRGPFCTFAAAAVRILRDAGRAAVRFEEGPADWVADGGELVRVSS